MADMQAAKPFTLDAGTLLSLGIAFSLMPAAQVLAAYALPKTISRQQKLLFLWHAYDFLTHFIIEGSFLFHCFFSYTELSAATADFPYLAVPRDGAVLFGHKDRRYGALSSTAPMARLWQEYAKADHRWGEADLSVISLEVLTVGLAGPAALYICYLISKIASAPSGKQKSNLQARMWFLAIMLATGELYGGFMTFAPEWLSGNTNLQGDDPVYLWLYLVFFNVLWVFIPFWILWEAWSETTSTFERAGQMTGWKKGK
jgi:hypothetical protein